MTVRVVLADDHPMYRYGLTAVLGQAETIDVVAEVGSGPELLAVVAELAPDVVVTDLGLPDGSGIEIGRALGRRLPVIALSGYGSPQDIQRSTAAGFAGHIVKPAGFSTVHAVVQKALAASAESGR